MRRGVGEAVEIVGVRLKLAEVEVEEEVVRRRSIRRSAGGSVEQVEQVEAAAAMQRWRLRMKIDRSKMKDEDEAGSGGSSRPVEESAASATVARARGPS